MNFVSKITNNQSSVVCYLTSVFCILSSVSFFGFLSYAVCPLSSVFIQNKPNSPIVQMNVTLFTTMYYAIFTSLTKVKNKSNQTQNKPNFENSNFCYLCPANQMLCSLYIPKFENKIQIGRKLSYNEPI